MEQLLDREAQLRDDEREASRRRELHLQSQVDMLLSVVSQKQTERSLPPSASPSQLLHSRTGSSTPEARDLDSDQDGPAHQSHGTFDEPDEAAVPADVKSALDELDSASSKGSSPGQGAPRNDVQEVVNAVLSGNIDPLEDDFFLRYAEGAGQRSDLMSDAASPAPAPPTPTASRPVEQPTASAQGGAVPPHVAAALDESRDALQSQQQESGKAALEHQKAAPGGPPPVLNPGDDDIYWVGQLHVR